MARKRQKARAKTAEEQAGKRPLPAKSSLLQPDSHSPALISDSPVHTTAHVMRETAVLDMQRALGNAVVGQTVQRRGGAAPAAPPERTVAERIVHEVQQRGGITVAVYVFHTARAASEFRRQANQYADDHQAIGVADGRVRPGTAMEISTGLADNLQALQQGIQALLLRYPDLTNYQSIPIPIRNLAIFTHGGRTQLQAGPHASWIHHSLEPWVEAMAPYLSPSPRVMLYACSVSGDPPRGLPFAEAMREMLQNELEQQYGPDTEVSPEVWGHTRPGHTTANALLRGFSGGPVSSAGEDLLAISRDRLAALAVEQASRADPLTPPQQTRVENQARRAMRRVWRATTGKQDPTNVFIREIPQMGIDRVWELVTTPATPDMSDLGMTPEATARLVEGLHVFQGRFAHELERLTTYVRGLH